jgi:hypothetical protein
MFKKILTLLLVSFLLVSAETVTKTYKVGNSIKVKDGHVYIAGGRMCMEGFAPAVAVKGMVLACPSGQKAKTAKVTYGKLVQVPGNYNIKPTIPAYHTQNRPSKFNRENIYQDATAMELLGRYYEKDALYPGISESYPVGNQYKFGLACAVVVVHPVQYNPVREELFYYDQVTVSIETEPISPADQVAAYVMTPFHRSVLQFTVDNPEVLADLELTPMDGDDYEVLVITYPTVQSKFDDYVALNKRRGLRTKVVLIADVLQTSGPTNQDKIRNYVKNEYETSKIVFVVLGGDINQVVHRELYSESYDHNQTPDRFLQKYSGSDLYYVTLDGNWNNDGDNKYGEPGEEDLLWEVYIGRMSIDNTTHLTNILTKTAHYCETPHKNLATNVLLAGEFLWDDYGKTIWGMDNLEYCVGYKDAYGFKTYGWPAPPFTVSKISDKETGAAYGWDGGDLRAKILSTKPAWIDHDGHANSTYCFTFNASEIDNTFTNVGASQNYWIGVSQVGCNPAQVKVSDCFMERAVYSSKGAVAMQGNWDSGYADDDDNNSQATLVCRHERDALFNPAKRVPFLAAAHAIGKEALIDVSTDPNAINLAPYYGLIRYQTYNTNTLGDPALSVWTDTPKELTEPFDYTAGPNAFTMNTPPYTCIALANATNDEIFTAQITGYQYTGGANFVIGDSLCSITDDSYKANYASLANIKMFIKAPNYLPAVFTFPTSISNVKANKIHQFSVKPVNGKVLINFALPVNEYVNVSVYNSKGVLVKTLFNKINNTAGLQTVKLGPNDLGSGVYYCKLKTESAQNVASFCVTK